MSAILTRPLTLDLPPPGAPRQIEMHPVDDRRGHFPSQHVPPAPMHPMHAPENSPTAHAMYDGPWRNNLANFDRNQAQPRRPSNPAPPFPSHGYPGPPDRELPHPVSDGHYGRPNSLPAPTPPDSHPPLSNYPSVNGTAHETSPYSAPPSYTGPPDYRPRMPYLTHEPHTNGDHPPSSIPPAHYSAPSTHAPATSSPYDPVYYHNQTIGLRKQRARRAQQACDQCRARKAKCDEERPSCGNCKENSIDCVYKEAPPHKQDKSNQLVLDQMQHMQASIDIMLDRQKSLDPTIREIRLNSRDNGGALQHLKNVLTQSGLTVTGRDDYSTDSRPMELDAAMLESIETQLEELGPLAIPIEHTTAAHKLLRWPWIQNLLSESECDEDYVMGMEGRRGLIRVYGRGEGDDPIDDWSDDDYLHDDASSTQSKEPPGVSLSGMLTADPSTVKHHHESYLKHMHVLHPFLHEMSLGTFVQGFINSYCASDDSSQSKAMFGDSNGNPRGAKRRRTGKPHSLAGTQPPVKKTIHNAIILLVLALGAICDWRDRPLPGPHDEDDGSTEDAASNSSFQSPNASNLPAGNQPNSTGRANRVGSRKPTNRELLPGFSYYAYASEIVGANQGGNRLPHVQAALLAGLYMGQLAHPFQSYAWISQAARACQVLIGRQHLASLRESPMEQEQIRFAYWTCLQLDSDILAELDLPASGITRSHKHVNKPKGIHTLKHQPSDPQGHSLKVMLLYSAQIYLRNVLNDIHTDLYKGTNTNTSVNPKITCQTLKDSLDEWRGSLPPMLRWDDSEAPATDINIARLRAKYYGAMYVSLRPVLYHCLQTYCNPDEQKHWLNFPAGDISNSMRQNNSPLMGSTANTAANLMSSFGGASSSGRSMSSSWRSPLSDMPAETTRACIICIQAAMQSTVAFDGVKGRPVVTNIFGTAHAQFGNMLVLSATFTSPFSELVPRHKLDELLRRTIRFLREYRNVSPTLREDAKILQRIYNRIFQEGSAKSFSSRSTETI